ncbi:hypothetical protein [Streptomyces sp. b84]|uniref:hypothetical protein n=1 Tax=Streptomyces sp. b84 TaxID=1827631 RepID=UPI000BF1AF9A|nr:hypothetical protein [Streptomyces sp. b84]
MDPICCHVGGLPGPCAAGRPGDTSHVREIALYSSWLAQAYVDANEIDEAVAVASRVYDLAAVSDSPRAVRLVDALAPHQDTPAVRDLLAHAVRPWPDTTTA